MALNIAWTRRALHRANSIAEWYKVNMSTQSAQKFVIDLKDTILRLSESPTIGIKEEKYSKNHTYFSFLIHPNYRLIYRYDTTTLFIIALRATKMK